MEHETENLAHLDETGTRRQTVREHLLGTAALAAAFAQPFGGEEQAALAGLLHDIGKYSDAFQRRLRGGAERVDHSTAGAQVAFRELHQPEIAFAVAGHHAGLPDGGSRTDTPEETTLFGRLRRRTEPCAAWRQEIQLPAARRPSALPTDGFTEAFYTRMLYSCLVDADFLDTEAFMRGAQAPRGGYAGVRELLNRVKAYVADWNTTKNELNERRSEILRACFDRGAQGRPGLYTLTVPTGGGKTIASLAFALSLAAAAQKTRVIYVIPYTTIIDQNAAVFEEILGSENVVEHHAGVEYEVPEQGAASPSLYRKALATENWDAPVIVTTSVQFFESLYGNRSSRCRKLHNIADSVVIFDEAQMLPVSYLRPCVAAIAQLVQFYGVTAVLCTATQPALAPLFAAYAPGLPLREICPPEAAKSGIFQRTVLRQAGEQEIGQLTERWNKAGQILCIVNRRATARQVYDALNPEGRYCLTTLLCPVDRKRLLREIRDRLRAGEPCRVVATSLIEAGVDVDFPAVWREEAGLDSILQAAGRCNREGTRPASQSEVFLFRFAGLSPPPMLAQAVAATRKVLQEYPDPTTQEAIHRYFSILLDLKELDKIGVMEGFRTGIENRVFPFATVAERFHLIDTATQTVYLPLGEGAALLERLRQGGESRAVFRRLGQYAVNVYPAHLQALDAVGAVERIAQDTCALRSLQYYDPHTGLALEVEGGAGWMI